MALREKISSYEVSWVYSVEERGEEIRFRMLMMLRDWQVDEAEVNW